MWFFRKKAKKGKIKSIFSIFSYNVILLLEILKIKLFREITKGKKKDKYNKARQNYVVFIYFDIYFLLISTYNNIILQYFFLICSILKTWCVWSFCGFTFQKNSMEEKVSKSADILVPMLTKEKKLVRFIILFTSNYWGLSK